MTVVGFLFTKINAEKTEGVKGKINIANNVTIQDVSEAKVSFGTKDQQAVNFKFKFTSKYEPKAGEILLEGNVMYLLAIDKAKKTITGWKKDKKIEKQIMQSVLNMLITKCNIQALIMSKEINLPPPIPLPKIESKQA